MTTTRVLLLVGLVLAALLLGWLRARTDGRARAGSGTVLAADDLGHDLGDRATLVQFSTVVCAPCRATKRVLAAVADATPGVRHVELDAEQRLDLARRLGILRAPTVLVLDRAGREVARASGVPTAETITRTLDSLPA